MKHALPSALIIILLSTIVMANEHSYVPVAGFVPDEQTAITIAEAILAPIYGADRIKSERPFTATLKDGIWTVVGSLPRGTLGGVAIAEIAKSDGRVQRVSHGK